MNNKYYFNDYIEISIIVKVECGVKTEIKPAINVIYFSKNIIVLFFI